MFTKLLFSKQPFLCDRAPVLKAAPSTFLTQQQSSWELNVLFHMKTGLMFLFKGKAIGKQSLEERRWEGGPVEEVPALGQQIA